ncbi:hypothetical protein CCR75_004775 [Bremia lactucae]|uniref:Multidrug and toxin extrusion protein n=1 Tax=Bremia lactucae TaxID=4779 RepID=A0A976IFC0_BRELC|nr:hypothetical protein CCR75_004323 [Bremia lactucae]TDH69072.1 hypothetical protein CCR75_005166 [Bremia lactucae]TDH69751.1 hypothetical protein CCR75_001304 [Bremia lactucae]TDH69855.1 hypothetical protein CCR75_004775 [Bremia lactucae]
MESIRNNTIDGDSSSGSPKDIHSLIRNQKCFLKDKGLCNPELVVNTSTLQSETTFVKKNAIRRFDSMLKKKMALARSCKDGNGPLSSTVAAPSIADKLNQEKWPVKVCNPRAGTKAQKRLQTGLQCQGRINASLFDILEESGEDSETSNSSYSSSNSSEHTEIFCQRFLYISSANSKQLEGFPLLLPPHSRDFKSDLESGARNSLPTIKTEVFKLVKLANPVIWTYVLEFFPSIVSMTLVGHLKSPLTKQYLDGVALSTMVLNLTAIGIGFGLATAMDTLCSQAYGAKKAKKLGIYLQSGLIVLGVTYLPVFLLNWYTEALLVAIGQPAQVAAFAGRFSQILLPGIPALYVYELFKKVLQAQHVVLPMVYIAVISNLVNVFLGGYLTFYTSCGFDGTAIARLVSDLVLPFSLIPYFYQHPYVLAKWWPGWHVHEAMQHVSIVLELGLPGAAMLLLEWMSFEIMAALVGLLPHSIMAITVHSVLVNVSTFAFNFFLGISVAANVLVGTYLGSNKPQHARMASMLGMVLAVLFSVVLAVVIVATRYLIPAIFINDTVSIASSGHAILYLMPYQLCDALNAVMQGVLRGTGRLSLGATINLFSYFVLGLPLGTYFAFSMGMGVPGFWAGLTIGIVFGCVVSFVKICETDWNGMADDARVRTS